MTTREQTERPHDGLKWPAAMGGTNLELMSQMYAPFLSAQVTMLNWQAANCRRMGEAYAQWFAFLGHRLEADATFAEKLQTAKNAQQVTKTCSKFLEDAAEDYKEEASELAKLSASIANQATDAIQDISAPTNGAVMGE